MCLDWESHQELSLFKLKILEIRLVAISQEIHEDLQISQSDQHERGTEYENVKYEYLDEAFNIEEDDDEYDSSKFKMLLLWKTY